MRNIESEKSYFNRIKFFNKFPILEVDSFVLRELMLSDSLRYYNLLSDPKVSQYLSDEDIPSSLESAKEEIKFWGSLFYMKSSVYWCIADATSNELIGTIGFNSWNLYNKRAEISYELMSQYWRRGIMSKIISRVLKFAFINMDINRIEAKTMVDNIASQCFLQKHNFAQESILREYRNVRGQFIDVITYSLLKSDWQSLK